MMLLADRLCHHTLHRATGQWNELQAAAFCSFGISRSLQ